MKFDGQIINGRLNSFNSEDLLENDKYIIGFYGRLNNRDYLVSNLNIDTKLKDNEIVLEYFDKYNENCLDYLDGTYSFAIYSKNNNLLFLAKDRLGVKPLYYTKSKDSFIFATDIKDILSKYNVEAVLGKKELIELLGLGPAHTPGKTFFKNIFELKVGHYAYLEKDNLLDSIYWDLTNSKVEYNINECISNIKEMVTSSLETEIKDSKNLCTMLSGGLDSSILTKLTNNKIPNLNTFSINYENNDKDFSSNSYQPTKDSDYVEIMNSNLNNVHHNLYFSKNELLDSLEDVVIARGMPGMGDIDSSMYVFCKRIKELGFDTAISGECSDEIFLGYPWFYREGLIDLNTFPWAKSISTRKSLINKELITCEELENHVQNAYISTLANVKHEDKAKQFCYLTVKWFMNTLIERTERCSSANNLDVRIPFANYKIFEYVYNIPSKLKLGLIDNTNHPTEKYLLRLAFEDILPYKVVYRKKSPFPKTYDPEYTNLLEEEIKKIIRNSSSPLLEIIDIPFLFELLNTHGKYIKDNWFGQLMTYPQILAYLIQINIWLTKFNVKIDI